MTVLHYRTAMDVAAAIARKELSSSQVTEHLLERIRTTNPTVNAVVELAEDDVLAAAGQADEHPSPGPLNGVPMTVKDAIDVAGLHTTWGNPEWKDAIAGTDAAVVARLRAAGALIAGKTNVAMMLGDFGQTSNPLFGTTNNPWDSDRSVGGSSGGSAAAVAAGMSYLEYGSDVVGSVRIPAAMCGVYGLKPTPGIVPLVGFQPPGPPALPTLLDHMLSLGPIARSAADIRQALNATGGLLAHERAAYRWELPPSRRNRLIDFRVGLVLDDPDNAVTSEVGDVLSNLADALAAHGVHITAGWPDGFDTGTSQETFEAMVDAFLSFKQCDTEADSKLGALIGHDLQRRTLQRVWDTYFDEVDVFLCPTTCTTAVVHDDRPMNERTVTTSTGERDYLDLASWIPHASIAGLPALSAPTGLAADGLPVGLQIIGPRYEEETAITFAELLADDITGFQPPNL